MIYTKSLKVYLVEIIDPPQKIQQINTHDSDLLQADSNTCVICLSQFGYKTSLNANAIIWIWYIIVICSVSVVDAI